MKTKQVIVIRKDLNMRKGKMIAQGAHASTKVLLQYMGRNIPTVLRVWLDSGQTKVVVSVDSESELLSVHMKAKAAGIDCSLIQDAGHTEFNGVPTYTAVAIGPDLSDKIDPITGELKLL